MRLTRITCAAEVTALTLLAAGCSAAQSPGLQPADATGPLKAPADVVAGFDARPG